MIIIKIQIDSVKTMKANHFDLSDSGMEDNEFLLTNPPSRITFTDKDQMIKKLQTKNERLRIEVLKIQNILIRPEDKTIYGNKIPEMKSQVTNKQLQNAYKQIKSYEYEVKKLKSLQKDGSYVEQIKKTQKLLKQKEELSQKLRKELGSIKRTSMDITKALKNDSRKSQFDNKISLLNSEVKWLREKVKEMEEKKSINDHNREQQLLFIRKLQSQLINNGYSSNSLVNLRNKFSTQQMQQTGYIKNAKNIERDEYVQDRTPETYKSLLNEIKLLQKLEKDYQYQLGIIEKQKDEAEIINLKSRNKLLQSQDGIETIQRRISSLKPMIDPRNLKPTRPMIFNKGTSRYGQNSLGSIKSSFTHIYKHEEIGGVSKGGKKFTDRIKIGKSPSKIVGVDFYTAKNNTANVVGLQATYEIKSTIKKLPLNLVFDIKKTTKVHATLIDSTDYFKAIQCIVNDKGLIVGLVFLSLKGFTAKAGIMQGTRKSISIDRNEYPACIYGSFSEFGIEMFGTQIIEDEQNNS